MYIAAMVGGLLVVMWLSAIGMRHNWIRVREARAAAPLDGLDLSTLSIEPQRTPARWPPVDDVADPAVAAGYASLADDRYVTTALLAELMVIAAGAVFGAAVTGWRHQASVFTALAAVALGGGGFAYRGRATRRWEPLAARYRARYRVLTAAAEPAPPAPVRRVGLLRRFRRR